MIGHPPPYALATPAFRFRALAALAGRAPLGGERELVLACYMAARLAVALLPPAPLPAPARGARASSARLWFASLALPAALRPPLARLLQASTGDDPAAVGAALRAVAAAGDEILDEASATELAQLAAELTAA